MSKRVVSVLAGLATGVVVIFGMEMISHMLYPMPKGIDLHNKAAIAEMIKSLPAGAFLMLLLAYAVGSFFGGLVAAFFADGNRMRSALLVGVFLTVSGSVNLVMIAHPSWFVVCNILVYVPFALLAGAIVQRLKNT